jgi:hypothetical protein
MGSGPQDQTPESTTAPISLGDNVNFGVRSGGPTPSHHNAPIWCIFYWAMWANNTESGSAGVAWAIFLTSAR